MSLLCSAWGLCVALLCTLYKAGPEALVCARDANCEQLWDSSQEIERRAEWGEEQEFLLLLAEKKSADNGQNVYFFSLSLYIFLIAIVLCCTMVSVKKILCTTRNLFSTWHDKFKWMDLYFGVSSQLSILPMS